MPAADHGWAPAAIPALRANLSVGNARRDRLIATAPPLIAGTIIFGLAATIVAVGCAVCCVVFARLLVRIRRGRRGLSDTQAILTGVLLALTLPPNVGWQVVVAGSFIAVVLGIGLQQGAGEYLWHPALVGRIGAQVLFPRELMPIEWPLLARGNLLFGNIHHVAAPAEYFGWAATPAPPGADGFLLPSVQTLLRSIHEAAATTSLEGPHGLMVLIRDNLPPWEDTVFGLTGGGIGETCAIALLASAGYLVYRGIVDAFVPLLAVLAALLTAALLPLSLPGRAGVAIPSLLFDEGDPVGWIYVLFEVTTCEILIVATFFVTDWPTSPMTRRGKFVFAAVTGALSIVLARIGLVPGAGYWAVLAANVLTPALDVMFARRVLGSRAARRVDGRNTARYISSP